MYGSPTSRNRNLQPEDEEYEDGDAGSQELAHLVGEQRSQGRVKTFNIRGGAVLSTGATEGRRWSTRLVNPKRPFYALLVALLAVGVFCAYMAIQERENASTMRQPHMRGAPKLDRGETV
jgi:hypothetical protein